ncbi:MAG: 2,3-diphosphoglycerate-dependent phosphoglycerate mutase [Gammaproteobacteria bacterium]
MIKVVFLRHGQSTWNRENRFTGWTDVDLSPLGVEEANEAGRILKQEGYQFDYAVTSVLKRSIRTLWIVQDVMDLMWLPVTKDWRLNERHYGALQGLNKAETAEHYGKDQVHQWRRGFAVRPPAMSATDARIPHHDRRYSHVDPSLLPYTESLQDTMKRALPCWDELIVPLMQQGKRLLVVAHGNSLRAVVKQLDQISDDDIMQLNIPTGIPLVYEFDDDLQVLTHYYLADADKVRAAQQAVAHQASA